MAFNIQDFLGGLGGAIDSLSPLMRMGGSYYAGQRSADRMEDAARSYRQLGMDAAGMASPVSNARRGEWDRRLSQLYENPQAFLEGNPEYKAALSLGTDELAARNAASGHNLGGKATTDQLRFLTKLGSQYIGKERDDLMNMAGYQFNPADAARFMMQGGQLEQEALTAAMAARLAPLGTLTGGQTSGGSQGGLSQILSQVGRMLGGGGGGGGGGVGGGPGAGISPQSILSLISQLPMGSLPPGMFDQLGRIGGGTEDLFGGASPAMLEQIFGPGYESFLTQNPDWWRGGGLDDTGLGGLGIGGGWESIFGGGGGGSIDMTGFITNPFGGGDGIENILAGMGLGG